MSYYLMILLHTMMGMYPDHELISLHTPAPVNIDGRLEPAWVQAQSVTFTDIFRRKSDNKVQVSSLWDEDHLYIAFRVQDKNLQAIQTVQDHALLSLDDIVEFLIDTRNKKDSCWGPEDIIYHINLLGQKKDDRGTSGCTTNPDWNGNAQYAVQLHGTLNDATDTDTGYDVEVAVSWTELGIKPSAGVKMGIDFANGDSGKLFDWTGASPFRSPYAFGNLVLQRKER